MFPLYPSLRVPGCLHRHKDLEGQLSSYELSSNYSGAGTFFERRGGGRKYSGVLGYPLRLGTRNILAPTFNKTTKSEHLL